MRNFGEFAKPYLEAMLGNAKLYEGDMKEVIRITNHNRYQDTHRIGYADIIRALWDYNDKTITFETLPRNNASTYKRCMISFSLDERSNLIIDRLYYDYDGTIKEPIRVTEHVVQCIDNADEGWIQGSPKIPYFVSYKLYERGTSLRTRSLPGFYDSGYFSLNLSLSENTEMLRIRLHPIIATLRLMNMFEWDRRVIYFLAHRFMTSQKFPNLEIEANHYSKDLGDIYKLELTTEFLNQVHKTAMDYSKASELSINLLMGFAKLLADKIVENAPPALVKWANTMCSQSLFYSDPTKFHKYTAYVWDYVLHGMDTETAMSLYAIGSLACMF